SQDSTYLDEWFDLRDPEAAEMDASLWFGEWGGTPDQDGMDRYIDEVLERADEHMIGWSWWSWDPGGWSPIDGDLEEMTENGAALQRVQPQAVSGTPEEFSWDQDESIFTMDWTGRSEVVEPTLIAVPEALFNDGIEVMLDGEQLNDPDWDRSTSTLTLPDGGDDTGHRLCIAPAESGACS